MEPESLVCPRQIEVKRPLRWIPGGISLQSVLMKWSSLPESFRGGCSVGAQIDKITKVYESLFHFIVSDERLYGSD